MRAVVGAVDKPVIVAGSINDPARIGVVRASGAAGFTIGSAAIDGDFPAAARDFATQIRAIQQAAGARAPTGDAVLCRSARLRRPEHMPLRAAVAFAALAIVAASSAAADPRQVSFPGAEGVTLRGWLYMPPTPGPHRAIVALHGCAGLLGKDGLPSARHADWGERWAKAGYVALFPDSYGSRGLGPQCKNDDRRFGPAANASTTPMRRCSS